MLPELEPPYFTFVYVHFFLILISVYHGALTWNYDRNKWMYTNCSLVTKSPKLSDENMDYIKT